MLQETSGRFFDKKSNQQIKSKDNQELLCACNGLKCEGICREQHLYKKRTANSKAIVKGTVGVKSWTNPPNQCPETYTKPQK